MLSRIDGDGYRLHDVAVDHQIDRDALEAVGQIRQGEILGPDAWMKQLRLMTAHKDGTAQVRRIDIPVGSSVGKGRIEHFPTCLPRDPSEAIVVVGGNTDRRTALAVVGRETDPVHVGLDENSAILTRRTKPSTVDG